MLIAGAFNQGVATRQRPPLVVDGLASLFKPGLLFQDRNGDETVDFVNARLILGDLASSGDVAAAANIAARLGFETSAMNLPVDMGRDRPAIIVSAAGLTRAGLSPTAVGVASLKPGEGIVTVAQLDDTPGVVIAGGDEAGTRAAAETFAARLPHVWSPRGATLETVASDVRAVLASRNIEVTSIAVPSAYVTDGRDALERLVVAVQVGSAADLASARATLRALRGTPGSTRAARQPTTAPAATGATQLGSPGTAGPATLSYSGLRLLRVRLSAPRTGAVDVDLPGGVEASTADPLERRPVAPKDNLDLSSFYTADGFLGDSDNNLIPDRVDVLLSPTGGSGAGGTAELGARLGLESAGISIPIARPAEMLGRPEAAPPLVLIGVTHPLVRRLINTKKFRPPALEPGQGLVQVVKRAFGEKPAVIITGGAAAGVARALVQVSERFPHIWTRGKDRTTLDDVEDDVRRFLSGRSPAGQAATALYKLDRLAADLRGKDLESARVMVSLEKATDGLEEFVRREAAVLIKAAKLDVTVANRDVQGAKLIFTDEFDLPSEVDDFWQAFRARLIPAVKKNQPVVLEARLSEPPEIRAQIEREARAALIQAGAADNGTRVRVLSAYKQGYSWLYDVVRPALAGKAIEQITIRFAEIGPPKEWPQQAMYTPTRWLLEIFPIDEVLAGDLKLDLKQIRFEKMPVGSPTYEVIVTGRDRAAILRETFEPRFVLRPYFDQFPQYEKVRVTTGWMTAAVAGKTVVDERIVTDPERFWDHFQAKTLTALYDYVMALHEGQPRAEDAPHFGELVVEVSLSEPEYEIGVDKEHISTMEVLHEEIFYDTVHFFDLLGRFTSGPELRYPGRIIPIVRPKADGKAGHAKITLTGFGAPHPMVAIEYRERDGRTGRKRLNIPKVALERPSACAAVVREGRDGLERLDLQLKVDTVKDVRSELLKTSSAEQVDRQIISAEQISALVTNLGRLRAAGLYREALAYHDLRGLQIVAVWDPDNPSAQIVVALEENGSPTPSPDIRRLLPSGYRHTSGSPLVQWETPIPPGEAYELLAKMSTFREATVYRAGQSYLDKDIWAMDLMPPIEASHWSQAKATTLKPTVVYSARQHANEISSTSHVLKLAELLLTDPEFRAKLRKVNVVVHPITNPDGAQLAYDLAKITPNHMLHAGYLGALAVDVPAAQWDPDPIYPESSVRPKLWRTWLPDIFLNPHGYPHHESVQIFSEYAARVTNRVNARRELWGMRGWYMPGFNYLDDPRYPRHKAAAFAIRERITKNINAVPEVRALNARAYDRYRRYTVAHDDENFRMGFTEGVLIYTPPKGSRASPGASDFMVRQPNVTIWTGSTEAPDETAYGDWLKLVATAGLQWDKAILQYLVDGDHEVVRRSDLFADAITLRWQRPRPARDEAVGPGTEVSEGRE